MREHLISQISDPYRQLPQSGEARPDAAKIAYSFGNEFYSLYKKFGDLSVDYIVLVTDTPSIWDNRQQEKELYEQAVKSAAKLSNMLEEKLISLRDGIK